MPDKSPRILVVDDNPASRYATSHVLRSINWTVLEADTGTDALSLVEQDVDLVVLDVDLPDLSGFEVCRRMRENKKLARIPVIHLSATFVKDVDKVYGLETGADGYLVHPVEPPVLIATVKAFLRARQAEYDLEKLLVSERAARADAEFANRTKDDFLATLSHELRTPLHAIIGWAQLLRMGQLSQADAQEAIGVIERNAHVQAQMIADLLDISRITSGKLRLVMMPIDPASNIESALVAISPVAAAKELQIKKYFDPALGSINADADRLQQIAWNLVNNAVKFTPKGGTIHLTLKREDSELVFTVADTGEGISSSLLPVIFDRFQQGDATTTRTHGGLGIGLAIVKQLVDLHGGTIAVESPGLGQGSTFTVRLPVASGETAKDHTPESTTPLNQAAPSELVRLDNVRVLLVEDEHDAREMLARVLRMRGAKVEAVDNMSDGLSVLESFQPQVLVSDLGMPKHDGFELISAVRGKGFTPEILPAIALSGFARFEDRERALKAGFQMHLTKPVHSQEIIAAIAQLTGNGGG